MSAPVKSAGTDGAWIAVLSRHPAIPLCARTHPIAAAGAEQRPIPITPALPIAKKRVSWPSYVMLAAIVFCLDHGNVGLALLVGVYWAGWTVNR